MSHSSFDPRICIREIIGESYAVNPNDWDEQYCIQVEDKKRNTLNVPIYLSEEIKSLDLPNLPFIDIKLMTVSYVPHDIGARTRKCEAYYDVGIWFTHTDNIDSTTFGKTIADEIQNQIRTHQEVCGFKDCPIDFINIGKVRYLEERNGRQVVFHYVVEVYCLYYD